MEEEAEEGRREIEKKNDEKKGNEAVKGLCYRIAAAKTPVRKKKNEAVKGLYFRIGLALARRKTNK